MSNWHGGKGSNRRPEDKKKIDENWDKIFAKPCPECKMKGYHKMGCNTGYKEKNTQ
jgi:hypothetical protein